MSDECLFCQILNGDIPSTKVYEDENVYGFQDLHPMAKVHWLFIHKKHTRNIEEMVQDPQQITDLYRGMTKAAQDNGLSHDGYRIVTNLGPNAGQTVFHTHFHLLAGERLGRFGS